MDLPARIGRYDVERLLGESGVVRALLGRDTVLGREVALDVLRQDLGLPEEAMVELRARMCQGAQAAASLSHPAMATLHDMGEDPSVGLYLVFERVHGPTLRERLERGPLAPAEVARLARALGSALTHAHAAGLVHGDVKPERVVLGQTGPKLTDLGIAHLTGATSPETTARGAPAYGAPEALASGAFTAQADQFSLAATLYEALTGRRAFPDDDVLGLETRTAKRKHAAPTSVLAMLRVLPHLDTIFDRALAKDAKKRFSSCEAFGAALAAELEAGSHMLPLAAGSRASIVPRATRRWQNAAIALAVLIIFALLMLGRLRPHGSRAPTAAPSSTSSISAP